MLRRVHAPMLAPGQIELDERSAHHVRDVLRLREGAEVELFDGAGRTAQGKIVTCAADRVVVQVESVAHEAGAMELTIASAIPKGERADWMIEKLCELGVSRFVPLITARSVVHPRGHSKLERWRRIAVESARQSRRPTVLQIAALTDLQHAIAQARTLGPAWYLSTIDPAQPLLSIEPTPRSTLFVGPEGGFTEQEGGAFQEARISPLKLTNTVLRVETAAIAAAALIACRAPGGSRNEHDA